jgi:nitrogen-specific signal transduction histidine kinase
MLGHELRNPRAAITTAAHVLDRVVVSPDGKADRIRESTERDLLEPA